MTANHTTGPYIIVDSFDGYAILAHPLPNRDDRIFGNVTCASHDVRIGRPEDSSKRLAILMHDGSGRYVMEFWEGTLPIASALLALPEREQYALAYTLFKQADECASGARAAAANEWATAFADGRIRKRRNGASVRVSIETPQEKAWRLGKKAA